MVNALDENWMKRAVHLEREHAWQLYPLGWIGMGMACPNAKGLFFLMAVLVKFQQFNLASCSCL